MNHSQRHLRAAQRHGLAMLELTLVAPLLLFVMALIINFGTFAAWKVRAEANARNKVWVDVAARFRDPQLNYSLPIPQNWAVFGASLTITRSGALLTELDDPRLVMPVVRGPLPQQFNTSVNSDLLDPATGFETGNAYLDRRYPLMTNWPVYHLEGHNSVMYKGWEFWQMGLSGNIQRRLVSPPQPPGLYISPSASDDSFQQAMQGAESAVLAEQATGDLAALQNDPEWIMYMGSANNFYPQLPIACTTDENAMKKLVNQTLISTRTGQIPRLPRVLKNAYIAMYQTALAELNAELNTVPPPPAATLAAIQAQISQVQQELAAVKQFAP
jgi:hypothetical protein